MSIQTAEVFLNTSFGEGFAWPDITVDGALIKRRMAQYGGVWYAEYACWAATAGAAFSVDTGVTADVWMIAPGKAGTTETASGPGNGGEAGAPFSWPGVELTAGEYTLTISTSVSSITGPSGTLSAAAPTATTARGTAYRLYGDANEEYGSVGTPVAPTAVMPGKGAGGCTFLPVKAEDTVYGSSSTRVGRVVGAAGIGAGGNGGARTDYMYTALQTLTNPGAGALGMVMFRVAV
ncbi:hypothetical protein FACS1894184_11700 [Clostridia bacterium]|nr:hypothetical protein FACS1894184_11700 [Clostridia bacterium]